MYKMATGLIVALVLAALGIVSNIGSGIANKISTDRTNAANKQQYEDWKEYNTPANQMERLQEAGLNPYMVDGVNNTLSQPFQVGKNTGIAELFSGLSQSLMSGAGGVANAAIQNQSLSLKKDQLDLNKIGMSIRERMARIAEKKGDAFSALLWSQGTIAELNSEFLRNTLPYRTQSSWYDMLMKGQEYAFHNKMFPLQLSWYEPMMRARVNNINANTRHISWLENYMTNQFLFNQEMQRRAFILSKEQWLSSFGLKYEQFHKSFGLNSQYYDLATSKFYWQMLMNAANLGMGFLGKGGSPVSNWNSTFSW